MLRELMPNLARVALMYNPESATSAGAYYLRPFMASAAEIRILPIQATVRSVGEIENVFRELASSEGSALIVMPDNFMTLHRAQTIDLADKFAIPTIYPYRYFAEAGGLISYGVDVLDLFRRAPDYVRRILGGAKPAELPVQAPTKFELAVNLKVAKKLGLRVPRILLAAADAIIE
jgi:putative ABC transport system substrate-binding protein